MGTSLGSGQTEDGTHSEREWKRGRILSTSERPVKTSELANEENEGVGLFESNRKSQDEGHCLNSSTFYNGAQAVGPEAIRHASRLGMTCTLTDDARKFRRRRYYRPTRPHLEGPSRLKSTYSTRSTRRSNCHLPFCSFSDS